jgi:hypothetical protein
MLIRSNDVDIGRGDGRGAFANGTQYYLGTSTASILFPSFATASCSSKPMLVRSSFSECAMRSPKLFILKLDIILSLSMLFLSRVKLVMSYAMNHHTPFSSLSRLLSAAKEFQLFLRLASLDQIEHV